MVTSSPTANIQTRTLFRSSSRQIPMPHNLRFMKENLRILEKIHVSRLLLSSHGAARLALLIQPKEFFSRFPYQRGVCKEVLAEMKANNIK